MAEQDPKIPVVSKDMPDFKKMLFAVVLRIAANCCFHGSSLLTLIDSCHGDSSIKGRDFTKVIILS